MDGFGRGRLLFFFQFFTMILGIVMMTVNLLDAVVNEKSIKWGLLILITTIHVFFWGLKAGYVPYQSALFGLVGLAAIYSKFPIEKILYRLFGIESAERETRIRNF